MTTWGKLLWATVIFIFFYYPTFGQIHVNTSATGLNNGTSWTNAYTDLQDALQSATTGDQIWVASGTYTPTTCPTCTQNQRKLSFIIPSGVAVLGGFPSTGNPTLAARDWDANRTILSGDIDNDGTKDNNSFTIVRTTDVNNQTILDGFTLRDGNASDVGLGGANGFGGAWYNESTIGNTSQPVVQNCWFTNNFAYNGGAIYNNANFNFGAQLGSDCNMDLINTSFSENLADNQGGAIFNRGEFMARHTGTYTNCQFNNNRATFDGGAIFTSASQDGKTVSTYKNCVFTNNTSASGLGGAIYQFANTRGDAAFEIIGCTFDNNKCGMYGGAISSIMSVGKKMEATIVNSIFSNNSSKAGGAIYSLGAFGGDTDYEIVNAVFYKNEGRTGGAIYFNEQSSATQIASIEGKVSNSIFKNNTAIDFDPLFHYSGTPMLEIQNSLIFDVTRCEDLLLGFGDADCVGGMIYNQNPLFVNENNGDFHLQNNSPALNTGNNATIPTGIAQDLDGNNRIANGTVDMGVYERVSATADSDNDGINDALDNCPTIANATQLDADGDGFGAACDCDDTPITGVTCNANCDTYYLDTDGDGFGASTPSIIACTPPAGYVANNQDCDDTDATMFPNAPELCDGKDNNCDNQVDEGTDTDGDGICNENDVCPNGDDTIDLNNNGFPDACEGAINLNCQNDIIVTAAAGQAAMTVSWQELTATTDCTTGGGNTGGGTCATTAIPNFTLIGSLNGHNYYLSETQMIWTAAQAHAISEGGYLAVINDADENEFIRNAIGSKLIHIGLEYNPTNTTNSWVNQEPVTYDNTEANVVGTAANRYGIMLFWNGKWAFHGDYTKYYVMEVPCQTTTGGGVDIQQTIGLPNGAVFPLGITPIVYTATDACNGTATCTFNVVVEASTSTLALTCPADISLTTTPGATTAIATWTLPTVTSDCAIGTTNLNLQTALDRGAAFPIGNTTVAYVATDQCGNSQTCSFQVTVTSGASNLAVTCPADINVTALAGATATPATWVAPTLLSDCTIGTPLATLTSPIASGGAFPIGTSIVTYEAGDACGSVSTCSFQVSVTSSASNLAITCPADINVTALAGATTARPNWLVPIPTSDCTVGIPLATLMSTIPNGGDFPIGTSIVTYEAADACGGTSTCSFQINVTSSASNLTITCPTDINVTALAGSSTAIATWADPAPLSDCTVGTPLATLMSPIPSGGNFPIGTTIVKYEAADACGDIATCSFQVVVAALTGGDLTVTCPQNITVLVPQGTSTGIGNWGDPVGTTTCSTGTGTGVSCTPTAINGFQIIGSFNGSNYYMSTSANTWQNAQQACENAGGHLVSIQDAAENDFILSNITDIVHIGWNDIATEGTFEWTDGSPVTYDNAQSFMANSTANNYGVMYNWRPGKWGYVNAGVWKKFILEIPCGGAGLSPITINQTSGLTKGSAFPLGLNNIVYEASDDCGNTATCSFTVTVEEQTVTCSDDINGGTIGTDEINCTPYTPAIIESLSLPSGGQGAIEYLWLASTTACPTSIGQQIPGASGPSLSIGFINQTTYFVRWSRRANCIDWMASNCVIKTVDDCGGPVATNYCESQGQQPWQEWIANVTLADLANPTGKSSLGYEDNTGLTATLDAGQAYEVAVTAGYSYTQWDENMYVWIDFNQDNDFTDAGELVLNKISPAGNPQNAPTATSTTFIVPLTAINGTTRMRVAMKRGDASIDPCATFLQGEVEDYTVMISGGANDRARTAAYLTFDAYPLKGAVGIEWLSNTANRESYFELEHSVDNQHFTRLTDPILPKENDDNYYQFIDETPSFGANYYRVKQVLVDGSTNYTAIKAIQFGVAKTLFTAFPNPASSHLTITFDQSVRSTATLTIVNLLGQVMETREIDNTATSSITISLDSYQSGLYTIYTKLKNQPLRSKVFIVDKG